MRHRNMHAAALALAFSCAVPVAAQEISLISPIDCDLETTCFVQQYVDRDPTEGVTDHRCSGLSYDGHKGTDFALPSDDMMRSGVAVLASADGVVKGVRDGMPDTGITPETAQAIKGRECGNGVRIDHAGGWSTQYCHLREGSVVVTAGQQVAAGDILGLVGKSGRAAFPHVHLSLRRQGKTIDPFDPDGALSCDLIEQETLWADTPTYRAGGLIALGFADAVPEYKTIKQGRANQTTLPTDAPALVIWGYSFGTQKNDILRLSLDGPTGSVARQDIVLTKPQAQSFRAIGKRRRNTLWQAGTYTGTATLIRKGKTLETRTSTLILR